MRLEQRDVPPLALGQVVGCDRAERRGVSGKALRCVRQRVGAFEPKAARRQRTEQEGPTQLGPCLEARLDVAGAGELDRDEVHPGLL